MTLKSSLYRPTAKAARASSPLSRSKEGEESREGDTEPASE